jgi:hypothetical protein
MKSTAARSDAESADMNHRNTKPSAKTLSLTEEEALALLEICFHSRLNDDPLKERVIQKVGDLCRDFIRTGGDEAFASKMSADLSAVRETLKALVNAAQSAEATCA